MLLLVCEVVLNLFRSLINCWLFFCFIILVNFIIMKICYGWNKLKDLFLKLWKIGFLCIGGSWYKLLIVIIFMFVNSWELFELNMFFSFWYIWRRVMLEKMDILFIIMSFSLDSKILIWVFFWLDIVGRFLFVFLGIVKLVFIVVFLMLMVDIFVGVINNIVGSFGLFIMCLNVLIKVW